MQISYDDIAKWVSIPDMFWVLPRKTDILAETPELCMAKMPTYSAGFFFTVAKKLKAKKTQATKKLKHFFSQKLKVPEDFSKSMGQKLNLRFFFSQNIVMKGHI